VYHPAMGKRLAVVGTVLIVAGIVSGCGDDPAEIQKECDAIANDIRRAASLRGMSSDGICTSSNPTIQQDFGKACADLKDCNRRVDEAS
jgi:hypothetical protein